MNSHRTIRAAALAAVLALASCASAEYRRLELLEQGYDAETDAYSVRVSFEVWQGGLPVQGLTADDIHVYEDGVRATSESIQMLESSEVQRSVTLLLDTSFSMYRAGAVEPLVAAAGDFVRRLEDGGFEVDVLRFDTEIHEVDDLDGIPTTWEGAGGQSRWTALYHALQIAVERHPDSVFVLFSDGADNFSQNHGVDGFEAVEPALSGVEIHAIGFGNARYERDRQGVRATTVLRALAADGTYHFADDEEELYAAFERVVGYIERRTRNVYYVEYFSPNRSGDHELLIRCGRAVTEPIWFRAEGP